MCALCVLVCVCVCVGGWVSQMMSIAVWCQVAIMCGYPAKTVRQAMHSAIIRSSATSHHDASKVVSYMNHVLPKNTHAQMLSHPVLQWIHRHCHWSHEFYATWRLPEGFIIDEISGDWSEDHKTLRQYWSSVVPPGHVCVRLCACTRSKRATAN